MGENNELKSLLQLTITAMNQNMAMQQQLISRLQEENNNLRKQMQVTDQPILVQQKNSQKSISIANQQVQGIEKEVISKVRRNKKRMIKARILETAKSRKISLPELKEIIVDIHQYCSKASFYRYAEDLLKNSNLIVNQEGELQVQEIIVRESA